jgi:hypothetical protein
MCCSVVMMMMKGEVLCQDRLRTNETKTQQIWCCGDVVSCFAGQNLTSPRTELFVTADLLIQGAKATSHLNFTY